MTTVKKRSRGHKNIMNVISKCYGSLENKILCVS